MANKPEWMQVPNPHDGDIDIFQNIRLATKQGFDEGVVAGQEHLLKHLRDHQWYTKIIPQGKGQRIISKRTGINMEFVESLIKQLEQYKNEITVKEDAT
jgi:hypothetical protein